MALHIFTCHECQDLSQRRANDCADCCGFGRITINDEGALSGEIVVQHDDWWHTRGADLRSASNQQWSASCDGMIAYGSTLGIALDRLIEIACERADDIHDMAEAD